MRVTRIGLFFTALLVSIAAYAATCPVDQSSATFTGTTRTDSLTGKLMYEHKCSRGHVFWTTSST